MEYCEHNRRSVIARTLYGNFRTYTCALDKRRGGDMIWKFDGSHILNKICVYTEEVENTRELRTGLA